MTRRRVRFDDITARNGRAKLWQQIAVVCGRVVLIAVVAERIFGDATHLCFSPSLHTAVALIYHVDVMGPWTTLKQEPATAPRMDDRPAY